MRRITRLLGLSLISPSALLFLGCGGGYSGGGYGGTSSGGGNGIATTIIISPASAAISATGTQQFTAVTQDSSGTTITGVPLSWNSSNSGVATINSNGLATASGDGTTTITASVTYNSGGVYTTGTGTTYTSNMATLTVTMSDSVMGTAATGHALAGALVTLKDAAGKTQTAVTSDDGHFMVSTAGMQAPFLIKADDGRGHRLFGAAADAGSTNIDTVTDFMLRAWYGAHGSTPEAAFADMAAHPAPDGKSLDVLDKQFGGLLGSALSDEGLDSRDFSLFSTPFRADGTGFDAVLDNTHALTGARLQLQDGLTGQMTEIGFDGKNVSLNTHGIDSEESLMMRRFALP